MPHLFRANLWLKQAISNCRPLNRVYYCNKTMFAFIILFFPSLAKKKNRDGCILEEREGRILLYTYYKYIYTYLRDKSPYPELPFTTPSHLAHTSNNRISSNKLSFWTLINIEFIYCAQIFEFWIFRGTFWSSFNDG